MAEAVAGPTEHTLPGVPRYRLTLAYDGTEFCGWQKQEPSHAHAHATGADKHVDADLTPGRPDRVALRTVQAVVERAVRDVVRENVSVRGASRTDSGVHARGQSASFDASDDPASLARGSGWPVARGTESLVRALNGRLPDDVLVVAAEVVPPEFRVISGVESKGYSYTIHASRTRPLWDRRYVHQVWEPLDIALMREAAAALVGEHDFAAFAAAGHNRLTTVRTIHDLRVSEFDADGARRIRIDISGNGFLWNMVRIVAGTLADVGRGVRTVEDVRLALRTGDRRLAGPTFPASGLCLEWVRYGGGATGDVTAADTAGDDDGVGGE